MRWNNREWFVSQLFEWMHVSNYGRKTPDRVRIVYLCITKFIQFWGEQIMSDLIVIFKYIKQWI